MTTMESMAKRDIEIYLKVFTLEVAVRKAKALRMGHWDAVFDKVAKTMEVK